MAEKSSSREIRLLCWNVHYPTFAKDNNYVVEVIQDLGPFDVICLQEFVDGASEQTVEWLHSNGYDTEFLPFASNGTFSQGVMTAVRKGFKASTKQVILREDEPRRLRPFPNLRGLLATDIDIGGKQFLIFNTHLTVARAHLKELRAREFRELQKFLAKNSDNSWLLCGDFNFVGADPRRRALTRAYESFSGGLVKKTWRHHHPATPIRANLDYFFWQGKNYMVKPELAGWSSSDHRPLIATIQTPTP